MSNELIFVLHILLLLGFIFGALRLGKEALTTICCLQVVLANLFVIKEIELFSFIVTTTDAYAIGSILALNLLQEYFGRSYAKKVIWINFAMLAFLSVMIHVLLSYQPSTVDAAHGAFAAIFSPTPRIVVASFISYFIVQKVDVRLFAFLRKSIFPNSLPLTIFTSLLVTQLLDTVLFSYLGLYGIVSHIFDIMILSYVIKVAVMVVMAPFTRFASRIYRPIAVGGSI
ncbi:MAG: queuosine precursor transporter [Chlamydiia bacterium]|nr:queuosine precursor transporter [Chlamydiia bacterium]